MKLNIPLMNVTSLRRAREGQVLEGDVYSRDDQLVAERGTQLDNELLGRLDNFGVRQVVVRSEQTQWAPESEEEAIPRDASVVETRSFSGEVDESIRSLFAENSLQRMTEMVRYLFGRALKKESEEITETLHEVRGEIDTLVQQKSDLVEYAKDLDGNVQERVDDILTGTALDIGKNHLELDAPRKYLRDVLEFSRSREDVRVRLIELLGENCWLLDEPAELEEVELDTKPLPERITKSIRQLRDGNLIDALENLRLSNDSSDDLADLIDDIEREQEDSLNLRKETEDEVEDEVFKKSLDKALKDSTSINPMTLTSGPLSSETTDKVREFLERRFGNRERAMDIIESKTDQPVDRQALARLVHTAKPFEDNAGVSEEQTDESIELEPARLRDVLDKIDDLEYMDAVNRLMEILETEALTSEKEGRVIMLGEELEQLADESAQLRSRVFQEVNDPDSRRKLIEMLQGNREFDPDELLDLEVDMMLMEKLESHLDERSNKENELRSLINDMTTDNV